MEKLWSLSAIVIPKMEYKGSNGGYFVYNPDTHDLCWFKAGSEQSKAEAIASQLYSLANVPSAEMQLCSKDNGNACILSRYLFLDKVPQTFDEKKKLNQGFGMDVLLANWDAVTSHNAQISEMDNEVYRIDFGAAFDFGGAGGHNPQKFHSIPTEISSLLNPQYKCPNGGSNAEMYSALTREDLISSLKSICQVDDHEMAKVLQTSYLKRYTNILLQRKASMKEMLDLIVVTPMQNGETLFQYLSNITNKVIMNHITNAKTLSHISELKLIIDADVKDEKVKSDMLDKIEKRRTQIEASQQHTSKHITKDNLQNLLTNSIYTKNTSGNYVIDSNKQEYKDYMKAIEQHCGVYSKQVKSYLSSSIDDAMLDNMLNMLNYDNGKFIDIFTEDIKSFVIFYNAVKQSIKNINILSSAQWEALVNSFINPANKDEIKSVISYKSMNYKDINEALTAQKTEGTPPKEDIQITIDNLTSYIQTQEVPQDMVVYRGEGYQVLNSAGDVTVQFSDGSSATKPLGDLLQDAVSYPENRRNELINQLLDMNLVATQERFMSTSAGKNTSFCGNVEWELTVPAGSHALYAELANLDDDNHQGEIEFLLQRDSQIVFNTITYQNEKWKCQGTVNTP